MATERPPDPTVSFLSKLNAWGTSTLPPVIQGTLIVALYGRPLKPLSLLFAPIFFFSTYVNLAGFPTDSAGITCAWSGIYVLTALRRRQPLKAKVTARGLVRGSAIGLSIANCVAGGYAYSIGDRKQDEEVRKERNRWGEQD